MEVVGDNKTQYFNNYKKWKSGIIRWISEKNLVRPLLYHRKYHVVLKCESTW